MRLSRRPRFHRSLGMQRKEILFSYVRNTSIAKEFIPVSWCNFSYKCFFTNGSSLLCVSNSRFLYGLGFILFYYYYDRDGTGPKNVPYSVALSQTVFNGFGQLDSNIYTRIIFFEFFFPSS